MDALGIKEVGRKKRDFNFTMSQTYFIPDETKV
jgi:hypothetical protein